MFETKLPVHDECLGARERIYLRRQRLPDMMVSAWRQALLSPEQAAREALRAIRRQCMGCAGDRAEVRACAAREACALWHCRFGVRPQTYKAVRRRFFAPKPLRLL